MHFLHIEFAKLCIARMASPAYFTLITNQADLMEDYMFTPTQFLKSAIVSIGVMLTGMAVTENIFDREGGRATKNVMFDKLKSKKLRSTKAMSWAHC